MLLCFNLKLLSNLIKIAIQLFNVTAAGLAECELVRECVVTIFISIPWAWQRYGVEFR